MCGIAGFTALNFPSGVDTIGTLRSMSSQLSHRGPDDDGIWVDQYSAVALSHRRLSILDLSEAGHQPMHSHCGRYILIFNGEIYNHHDIRQELKGNHLGANGWRGHSDTETLLAAIACWGFEKALDKFVGMFAFVLWDRHLQVLRLAKDRAGEKPLYYGLQNGIFLFASELKAIRAYPGIQFEVDRDSLAEFLRSNVIPVPRSIYRDIYKLPPGTSLTVTKKDLASRRLESPKPYWSLAETAVAGQNNVFKGGVVSASFELESLLKKSIKGQMLSDVPIGAFLSGGIDSSIVVALMQAESVRPVKTFTIGFQENDYDEAQHARTVAAYLGTEHTELFVTPEQAMAVIPRLPKLYDEPFADASQIPTFLVSELAKRDVKVCLSGDGGDELFGGYNRYVSGARLWRQMSAMPKSVRSCMVAAIMSVSTSTWDSNFDRFTSVFPNKWRVRTPGIKLQKIANMLTASSTQEAYLKMVSQWMNPELVVIGSKQSNGPPLDQLFTSKGLDFEHQMMFWDTTTYLPDDILVKVDRASMGVSLETRVPMLDHRLVEFAWRLPIDMKIRGHEGKWLLRQVLDRYVPRSLIDRPKAGFSVPLNSWLRGPLKDWAEEMLDLKVLKSQGFFAPEIIRSKWEEHLDNKRDWSSQIWSVLMFQAWLNEQ